MDIYQAIANTPQEDAILQATPPSRPMGLSINKCFLPQGDVYYRNKITWNHNMEPDMKRDLGIGTVVKRYRVYKSSSNDGTQVPNEANAILLGTVDINENVTPEYIDVSVPSGCNEPPSAFCPPICWVYYYVRYYVVAVDKYNDASVKSDFVSSDAWRVVNNGGGEVGDNQINQSQLPTEYLLFQNYPNPFNPSTEISYSIPNNSFVTLKIYNSIGQLVEELVNNEFKNAGHYSINFDGSNLASGIYFYSLEAGNFKNVMKMVLLK